VVGYGKAIVLHKCPMVSLLVLVSWTITFLPTLKSTFRGEGFPRDCKSRERKCLLVHLRDYLAEKGYIPGVVLG
jgi:hypothetical protein